MSITKLNNLSISAVTALPSGVGGKVLQVVTTTKTDTTSATTSGTFVDLTGLSASITPVSSNSKVLVMFNVAIGTTGGSNISTFRILRDSTAVFVGNSSGSRTPTGFTIDGIDSSAYTSWRIVQNFVDSPNTTSSITYKMQYANTAASKIVYINSASSDTDESASSRVASSIILMEIAG